ncbi:MAG: family 20 glycosylhydrolase [Armatimonadota bacterium]
MTNSMLENLLPQPQSLVPHEGCLPLAPDPAVTPVGEDSRFAASRLADLLAEEFGLQPLVHTPCCTENGLCAIRLGPDPPVQMPRDLPNHPEGFVLTVTPSGAAAWARTSGGVLHAAMTLRQLAQRENGAVSLPCATIRDWPRFPWRAFMIDSGRSPNSLSKIKRIIRICSAFRLNCLIFREGDDELNAVRYRSNPLGSENPYALTMDEVTDMVEYARRFGISVVPEVESLGHSSAKGRHYPDLVSGGFEHDYGFVRHIRKSHLAPGDPRSYELLRSIYEEWLPLLPEPMLHLGLDEVRLPPEEQERHLEGLLRLIDDLSEKAGRQVTPIVWGDAPPTPPRWKGRVVRCLWNYGDGDPNTPDNPHLLKQNAPALLSGDSTEPVFLAGGSGSLHVPDSKSGYREAVLNLLSWAQWARDAENVTGLLAVQWSGNSTDDWLPDFLTAADFGWNVPAGPVDPDRRLERVRWHLSRLRDAADPAPDEVDPPCWDGIWLKDGDWFEDIASGIRKP